MDQDRMYVSNTHVCSPHLEGAQCLCLFFLPTHAYYPSPTSHTSAVLLTNYSLKLNTAFGYIADLSLAQSNIKIDRSGVWSTIGWDMVVHYHTGSTNYLDAPMVGTRLRHP